MTNSVRLIFIEKKDAYSIEAQHLLHNIHTNLNIKELRRVRILIKYLVTGVDDQTFTGSLDTIFSEPPVDTLFHEEFSKNPTDRVFGVAFLPGQFDQRGDSAEQCLKLINPNLNPKVLTAVVYVLEGKLSSKAVTQIKKYLINNVDSHEVNVYDKHINLTNPQVDTIPTIAHFRALSHVEIKKLHAHHALAMSIPDLLLVQKYFVSEKRDPTITEIKVIDTY
jgi:phosphoribosylformylglycinamidine synthase